MGDAKFAKTNGSLRLSSQRNKMTVRTATLWFSLLLVGSASAQSNNLANNLLKNPDGEDALQAWRVSGNAEVTNCVGVGNCFSISQDGFIFQDVTVPENVTGEFALLIALASTEEPNADIRHLAHPYLFGYFMSSPNLPQAKILSNLSGQEMAARARSSSDWVKQFGVFKLVPGTLSIRIFLRSGCPKAASTDICTSRFRRPGIFRFQSEAEARTFADNYQ